MSGNEKVVEYKENIKKQAETLILKEIPETIVKLNNFLEKRDLRNTHLMDVHQVLNIPIPEPIILKNCIDMPVAKNAKLDAPTKDDNKTMIIPTETAPIIKNVIPEPIILEDCIDMTIAKKPKLDAPTKDDNKTMIIPTGTVPINKNVIPEPIISGDCIDMTIAKKAKLDASTQIDYKTMIIPTGTVPINENLIEMIDNVKPIITKMVEEMNLIKMWISFLIPKIEDGNNFGVSIQRQTLAEVKHVKSHVAEFFSHFLRYYSKRAKLISKVMKYPHIEDYRQCVREHDEQEYLNMWLIITEIRNMYCILHDLVLKNLDKIKNPKTLNATESLY